MNIYELSEISGQSLYITWEPKRIAWCASFGANVVTHEPGASLPDSGNGNGICGFGKTPEEALGAFIDKIRGKYIKVRHSYSESAYLGVPQSLAP